MGNKHFNVKYFSEPNQKSVGKSKLKYRNQNLKWEKKDMYRFLACTPALPKYTILWQLIFLGESVSISL